MDVLMRNWVKRNGGEEKPKKLTANDIGSW